MLPTIAGEILPNLDPCLWTMPASVVIIHCLAVFIAARERDTGGEKDAFTTHTLAVLERGFGSHCGGADEDFIPVRASIPLYHQLVQINGNLMKLCLIPLHKGILNCLTRKSLYKAELMGLIVLRHLLN